MCNIENSVRDQMIIPGMGRVTLSCTNLGTDPELMRSFEDVGFFDNVRLFFRVLQKN